jgi:Tfp pilus assembly protein PilV
MRLPGVLRRLRDRTDRTSESGWALIETMFAAVLLVVIALAVMSSMDVASRTSAANKGRTVASSLAEQDQERMRAMTIDQLSNYHASSNPTVAGIPYHVDSRSEWVIDPSGNVASCTDTGQASYVRVTSTVTSTVVGTDTKPVTLRGIVAPPVGSLGPNQGTLAVKVTDHANNPVANLPVTLSGSKGLSDTTNALGCVVFGYIPAGSGTSYTVTLDSQGWVDQNDSQQSQKNPTVTPGNVTLQQMTYDLAGAISLDYRNSANQTPTTTVSTPKVMLNNSSWSVSPTVPRTITPPVDHLFPFTTSAYTVYAGSCAADNPTTVFAGDTAPATAVAPGQTAGPLVVRVPTLSFQVQNSLGAPLANATVSVTATGSGCTEKWGPFTDADGNVSVDLPYGTYTVCASAGGKYQTKPANNGASGGTVVTTVGPLKPSSGVSGVCT